MTILPEAINGALDDQLFLLRQCWPNDFVSIVRWCNPGANEQPYWYATTSSQLTGPHSETAEGAVAAMLAMNAAALGRKKAQLLSDLESVEARLAAQKEKA